MKGWPVKIKPGGLASRGIESKEWERVARVSDSETERSRFPGGGVELETNIHLSRNRWAEQGVGLKGFSEWACQDQVEGGRGELKGGKATTIARE